jgi:hypothetical protein
LKLHSGRGLISRLLPVLDRLGFGERLNGIRVKFIGEKGVYSSGQIDGVVQAFLTPLDPRSANPAGIVTFAANLRVFAYDTLPPAKANLVSTAIDVPAGVISSIGNLALSSYRRNAACAET